MTAPPTGPNTDLEVSGFNRRPTRFRAMTPEMNLCDDVSAAGAAANATARDVQVKLFPAADSLGSRRVSFGFPLPPGTLLSTSQIKVTNDQGQEIPAFVRSLGAWERMPSQDLLCNGLQATGNPGIRSVLVQLDMSFASTSPVTVTVGVNRARTQNLATEVPVANTYRTVTDGTYRAGAPGRPAGFNLTVREPAVLAAIDHKYLACTSMVPMLEVVGKKSYLAATDKATEDFFYSTVNEFAKRQSWPVTNQRDIVNFFTVEENWLYDRAQTFYNDYIRTGNADVLREANRASNHYVQNVYGPESCTRANTSPICVGSFKLKNPDPLDSEQDPKYSYSENLFSNYMLNGDASVLKTIGYVSWLQEFQINLTSTEITERFRGFALLAHAVDFELTGSTHELAVIRDGIAAMRQRQTSPLDGNAPNGCFNYPPEGKPHTFSPWFSSLLTWGFVRAYQATGDTKVPPALSDFGKCEVERALDVTHAGQPLPDGMNVGSTYPFYIGASFGPKRDDSGKDEEEFLEDGFEHTLDVAVPVALGAYFSADPARKAALTEAAKKLLLTHEDAIRFFTRENQDTKNAGRTRYRVEPTRKYFWQYKNAGVIGWALDGRPTG